MKIKEYEKEAMDEYKLERKQKFIYLIKERLDKLDQLRIRVDREEKEYKKFIEKDMDEVAYFLE